MSWLNRLKEGLSKSSKKLSHGITTLVRHRRLDESLLEGLEDLLLQADLGVGVTGEVLEALRADKFDKEISQEEVRSFLADQLAQRLAPFAGPLALKARPEIVLVVGVNGSGKTTTIAKLGALWAGQGKSVRFGAGDTFRAAAVEQLKVWGARLSVPVVSGAPGVDAAALAYDAVAQAMEAQDDVLLMDTAGRLHTNTNLMEELKKIKRVIKKANEFAPHQTILVLDATIGQNAYRQVEVFHEAIGLSGLVITKLDGTAKGGVVIGLAQKFKLPIYAVGVGEKAQDLQPFDAKAYAQSLMGF